MGQHCPFHLLKVKECKCLQSPIPFYFQHVSAALKGCTVPFTTHNTPLPTPAIKSEHLVPCVIYLNDVDKVAMCVADVVVMSFHLQTTNFPAQI
jgi:hypothetical protein